MSTDGKMTDICETSIKSWIGLTYCFEDNRMNWEHDVGCTFIKQQNKTVHKSLSVSPCPALQHLKEEQEEAL